MGALTMEEPRSDAVQSADASSEDRRERITQAQELHRRLDKTGQRVRRKLQAAMAILPREVELEASGKVAHVRREYERAIAENQLDDLADHLIADLYEALEELFEMLALRLTTIIDELRDELEECGVELGVRASLPDRMSIEISAPDPDKKGIDLRDLLVVPLIAVVGVVTMNPILMAGGASAALIRGTQVFDRSRKERARKQLADISSDLQRQLSFVLHQTTVEARSSLTNELDDALGSRRSDLDEEIRSLEESGPDLMSPRKSGDGLPVVHSRASSARNWRLRDRC
ncbi:MAG: hypothetical protein AABM42_07085 [Actinomycetota bacterium]